MFGSAVSILQSQFCCFTWLHSEDYKCCAAPAESVGGHICKMFVQGLCELPVWSQWKDTAVEEPEETEQAATLLSAHLWEERVASWQEIPQPRSFGEVQGRFSIDICIAIDVDLLILVSACQNPLRVQDVRVYVCAANSVARNKVHPGYPFSRLNKKCWKVCQGRESVSLVAKVPVSLESCLYAAAFLIFLVCVCMLEISVISS